MAERTIQTGQLSFRIVKDEPALWISRVVLYENTTPLTPLREIPLHRGLNVVWGLDDATRGKKIQPVLGHSVGKTALCRLIRYCMGEDHFADEDTRKAIRATFPRGFVGCEVHVAGQAWAVARPIGNSNVSYAKRDCTVDHLLRDRPGPNSFHSYLEALVAAICGSRLRPDLVPMKNWLHLLAWCSRDQEARYESLAGWRSPRSASGSPAFTRPKVEPIQFIRAAARILSKKELSLQKTVEEVEAEIEQRKKDIEERLRLPEYWVRHYTEELKRLGVDGSGAEGTLFQPQILADHRRQDLADQMQKLEDEIRDLDYQISIVAARIEEADQLLRPQEAQKVNLKMEAEEKAAIPTHLRQLLDELEQAKSKVCKYGSRPVGECSYAQDHLINVGCRLKAAQREAAGQVSDLDQRAAAVAEQSAPISKAVARLRREHTKLTDQRRTKEQDRTTLQQTIEAILTSLAELDRWGKYLRGEAIDPDWIDLRDKLKAKETALTQAQDALAKERQLQDASLGHTRRIFGGLVQSILSPEYQGAVQIVGDDLLFRIRRGSRLAGEALQTLSILLADVTCMVLGIENNGLHPRFLMHDSPREADLGLRIYHNYLSVLGLIHEESGGSAAAPFQYIVTTTTPPPEEIRGDDRLVMQLSVVERNLLFTRVLREPDEDAASDAQLSLGEDK